MSTPRNLRVSQSAKKELSERQRKPVPYHVVINPTLIVEPGDTAEFFEQHLLPET